MRRSLLTVSLLVCAVFLGCTKKSKTPTVWIYTSIYKDVTAEMQPALEKKFPGVQFEWFQSGSENVSARLNAELTTGKSQADLVMTSDPLWYVEAKKSGHLVNYLSPAASSVSADLKDADGAFATVRMPVAVIGFNSTAVTEAEAPKKWADLLNPKWKSKLTMPSPMESGTALLAVAQLNKKEGWTYFEGLRKNEILAAGGNSAVIQRIETKERPVGIVLLENILDAQRRKSPVVPVYPADGAILVPSPIAIVKKSEDSELVKRVYDYFFSEEMQKLIVGGRMYSPAFVDLAPEGAKPFKDVLANALPWNEAILNELYGSRESLKKQFAKTVLN